MKSTSQEAFIDPKNQVSKESLNLSAFTPIGYRSKSNSRNVKHKIYATEDAAKIRRRLKGDSVILGIEHKR